MNWLVFALCGPIFWAISTHLDKYLVERYFKNADVVVLMLFAGCTRRFFRTGADQEVESVLAEKDRHPAWKLQNFFVYPHPLARFADPTNPDRPPKPPDDPAAYTMSPNPQKPGKAGIKRIEGAGYLELIAKWDQENREKKAQEEAEEKESELDEQ